MLLLPLLLCLQYVKLATQLPGITQGELEAYVSRALKCVVQLPPPPNHQRCEPVKALYPAIPRPTAELMHTSSSEKECMREADRQKDRRPSVCLIHRRSW